MSKKRKWSRVRQGLTLQCWIQRGRVYVGEHCDNPHGPNSQSSCTLQEYVDSALGDGARVRSIVRGYFGVIKQKQVLASVQSQCMRGG